MRDDLNEIFTPRPEIRVPMTLGGAHGEFVFASVDDAQRAADAILAACADAREQMHKGEAVWFDEDRRLRTLVNGREVVIRGVTGNLETALYHIVEHSGVTAQELCTDIWNRDTSKQEVKLESVKRSLRRLQDQLDGYHIKMVVNQNGEIFLKKF